MSPRRPVRRVKRVAKRRARPAKPQRQARGLDRPPLDLARQTYLTVRQTMEYLQFPSEKAVYCWADRYRIPKCRAGGLLFLRRDLDAYAQKTRNEQVV